ncbi:MAG: hypothetical protein QGI60_02980 [archaeon]|nr:hypothetical protein [archaeon]
MGLKHRIRRLVPSVTASGKTGRLRAKAEIVGNKAAKKTGPKAKALGTTAEKLRKRVTRRTSIRPSLHMAFANSLRKLDVVKFRSRRGLGAFKNTRVGYKWGALSSAIKTKLKYFKVVDSYLINAEIKKSLNECKYLSEFAEKY